MKFLRALLDFIGSILKTAIYDWVVQLRGVYCVVREQCEIEHRNSRLPVRLRRAAKQTCVPISDPAYKRPDPMIYSQYYLLKQGLAVTWDNPDIEVHQGAQVVPSHSLQPGTDYEVVARIWNNSTEAPVVGLPVQLSFLSFGVGTQSHFIGETHVNLGVKGGPNHPAFAAVPWKTPDKPGHYCLQIRLEWIDDLNPNNNLGQENTDVGKAHSPAAFEFQLRNDTRERQTYRFEVDTYDIPPLDPCSQRIKRQPNPPPRQEPGTINFVPPKHDRSNFPIPANWEVTFSPTEPALGPGDEIAVHLLVTPPVDFQGRQNLNVNAFHNGILAGGITVAVERP